MKTLILALDGIEPGALFGDERLAGLRHLMDAGLYGPLDDVPTAETLGSLLSRAGVELGPVESLAARLERDDWTGTLGVELDGPTLETTPADALAIVFDDLLGRTLESMPEATCLLLVLRGPTGPGAFVLAGPGLPASGETAGATWIHLAPTLQVIQSGEVPTDSGPASLLSLAGATELAATGYSADEDRLIQERLSGLGYIA